MFMFLVVNVKRSLLVRAFFRAVGSAESDELVRHHHVEVAVLDALKILVLFRVEGLEVEELELVSLVHGLQAVVHRQVVVARAHRRVAEGQKRF